MAEAVIVDAVRTPLGKGKANGTLHGVHPVDLLAHPLEALVERTGVETIHAHDVGLANRLRAGLGLPPGDSAIVRVEAPGAPERLAAAGIQASTRAGAARLAFHLHNTEADADLALEALA